MFHNSTQRKFWTFANEEELKRLRREANLNYRRDFCSKNKTSAVNVENDNIFLSLDEHCMLVRHYEKLLRDFCFKFNPPMPLNTVGTACHYMKRLFVRKSVMEYHPRLLYLVCVWLACKTEEFNISMEQFMNNVQWAGENVTEESDIGEAILTLELVLIQELNFHLTVHNAFRPLEGFFIDVKTRFPSLNSPEQLRNYAKDFIVRALSTDAIMLFSPSQIAISALLSSASKRSINIDRYVTDVLLKGQTQDMLKDTIQRIKKIRIIVKNADSAAISNEQISAVEAKLEKCYNKEKDPTSFEYMQIQQELEQEKYDKQSKKRKIEQERRQKIETDLLGF